MADEVLTTAEAAVVMRCSVRTVTTMLEKAEKARAAGEPLTGHLVGFRVGSGWRVTRRALDAYTGVDSIERLIGASS